MAADVHIRPAILEQKTVQFTEDLINVIPTAEYKTRRVSPVLPTAVAHVKLNKEEQEPGVEAKTKELL